MSWAESRETTRAEDAAYSLLGLFGVFVPLIYGEGRKNSFRRLDRAIDEADITFNVMKKDDKEQAIGVSGTRSDACPRRDYQGCTDRDLYLATFADRVC
jgi:hypothetical protein